MTIKKENAALNLSFKFAVRIVNLYKYLLENKKEYIMSKQLMRSGTAIGALVREAQNAESKADFIHKLAIAQKECDETIYWIDLLTETAYLNKTESDSISSEAVQMLKIIKSSIITMKQKINHS